MPLLMHQELWDSPALLAVQLFRRWIRAAFGLEGPGEDGGAPASNCELPTSRPAVGSRILSVLFNQINGNLGPWATRKLGV